MTVARIAKQLDPTDVEEFQRLARVLLARGIVTREFPRPGLLPAIRRYEQPLRAEFERVLHLSLDLGPNCARLARRAAGLSPHRPARTPTDRRFTRWAYTYLCLVLASLERLGEQTTISQLADEVVRLRAGDVELPVDLTAADQRRGFVDALRWLETRGVLDVRDGDTERFANDPDADALYDIDRDIASRLLVATPSVLRDVRSAADLLAEPFPPTDDGQTRRTRYSLTRRILEQPAVYYEELPADELAYLRQNRGWLVRDLELLTGCQVEARAEGLALVDVDAGNDPLTHPHDRFPATGSIALGAMLLAEAILDRLREMPATPDSAAGRRITEMELDRIWSRVVERYGARFAAEYREDTAALLARARALLARLDLVVHDGDGLLVRPAIARFRPTVALASQPSLLETP